MDIQAILAKVANGEDITDEERQALQGATVYTQEQLDEEANARAAKARKQAESGKERLQSQLNDIQEERDKLNEQLESKRKKGGDEDEIEKAKAEVQKEYEKKLENLNTQLEEQKAKDAARQRKDKLAGIRKRVGFVDKDANGNPILDEETAEAILDRKFADVDTEDLDRDAVVNPLIKEVQTKNPHLIRDNTGGGTGHKHEEQSGSGSLASQGGESDVSIAERQKELREIGA